MGKKSKMKMKKQGGKKSKMKKRNKKSKKEKPQKLKVVGKLVLSR